MILNVRIAALLTLEPAPVLVQEAIQGNIVKVRVLQLKYLSAHTDHTLYTIQTTHTLYTKQTTHTVHHTDHTHTVHHTDHTHTVHHTDHTHTVQLVHTLQFCLSTAVCSIVDECQNNSTAIEENCRCECTKDFTGQFCEGEN